MGSTTTIVAGMYQDKGLMPTAKMAGLMAAAIVSDTVMFKSPTCTQRDIDVANRMARIANISLQALGQVIFSASGGGAKSAEEIFRTDYKEFHIAGHNLAVSQVTCMDSDQLLQRKGEFLQLMSSLQKKQGFDMVILMITDVLLEGTQLLFVGDRDSIRQAFNVEDAEDVVFLPKVMSRKKAGHSHALRPVGLRSAWPRRPALSAEEAAGRLCFFGKSPASETFSRDFV